MMKQTFVYRVSGEICFFFSVLNVFDAFRALRLPMALFAVACLALGLVIVRCKSAWLRFGLALLPGLSFLIGPWNLFLIAPGFAWLYYILVMTRGNYAYPLDEYRKTYTLLLTVCPFFLAANIANSTIYRGRLLSLDCLLYAFAFLLLGVMAMRRMQMGADMNRSWQLRNALTVAGFPLAAVGVSVLLFLLLRFSAPALRYLLTPLGHFVLWLLNLLFPGRAEELLAPVPTMKPEKNTLPLGIPDSSHGVRGAFDADSIVTGNLLIEKAASVGAYVMLGILLLIALALVISHARRGSLVTEQGPDWDEGLEESGAVRAGRKARKAPPLSPARQLRRIYKTYLEYTGSKGLARRAGDTSQDILDRADKLRQSEDARRLRELYIAARYGDPKAVTRDQVQEAQGCLERIVGEK